MLCLNRLSKRMWHNDGSRSPVIVRAKPFSGYFIVGAVLIRIRRVLLRLKAILVEIVDVFRVALVQLHYRNIFVGFGVVVRSLFES